LTVTEIAFERPSAPDWASYSHLVGWLRDTDVTSHALKLGDVAPDQIRRLIE